MPNLPMNVPDRGHYRWLTASVICLLVAVAMAMSLVYWGVTHDVKQIRATLIESEMNRLRTHATRTTANIQDYLRRQPKPVDLGQLRDYDWIRTNWTRFVKSDASRQYAAIINAPGTIVMHSDPSREGAMLEPIWYDRAVAEGGDDVVDSTSQALTGGVRTFVVQIPIELDHQTIGSYHSGLSFAWLQGELADRRANVIRTWSFVAIGTLILLLVSALCLYQIGRRLMSLREAIALSRVQRFTDLGQLVAGLAHEIRNPLNAIMLNNHVVSRFLNKLTDDGDQKEAASEQALIMKESTQEIERVEGMLRMLLGYARPGHSHLESLNLDQEVRTILHFLKETFEREGILLRASFSDSSLWISFDRDRLRQILLNLLSNARHAAGSGGTIQVAVRNRWNQAEIIIADDGPGVPAEDHERVFEPFYSTKENGLGLGLALVRRYVEEAGGTIVCSANLPRGARFQISLPVGSVQKNPTPVARPAATPG